MTAYVNFSSAINTDRANVYASKMSGGKLIVYTIGSELPSSVDTAISDQSTLIEFDLPNPSGEVTNGVFTSYDIDQQLSLLSGVAAFARVYSLLGEPICDLSVGATGSGEAIEISDINTIEGRYNKVISFNIIEG